MSSVSGVSSSLSQYQLTLQNMFKQRQQDFSALGAALQSGDLASAQKAYSALFQNTSSSSQTPNTQQSGNSGIQTDVNALGQALQSGDLKGAQSAYAKLQQDLQTAHAQTAHAHHHRHHAQGAEPQNASANSIANPLSTGVGDSNTNTTGGNSSIDISG
jgi:Skp family chaperone for outer membrane proteins